ncbi:probable cytochrome P450 6t3 [Drosophila grimshawi]|uniref:GH22796 n=1 Tax=Drosophila grimshawi TaxID=7222 RepID=B4JW69_DROGR|nr:probable cytochrome P450 6t3 [Drosophila grimshawi]XP_043072299.1 probable cytochrome P450 6t3 [Drosophila grimshawi]EDV98207.1 GH22796 [Drosophila grimshawi]
MLHFIVPVLLLLIFLFIYLHLKKSYSYFRRHRLPYLPASVWTPLGHLRQLLLLHISFGDLFKNIYADERIEAEKLAGFFVFQTPALILRDPEIIRLVLVKDFNRFLNRYEAADAGHDAMGALTLPLAKYHQWRESRLCMSQLFTSGRIKQRMYPLILEVLHDLEQHLERNMCGQAERVLPLSEMCQLYTTDVTGKLFYSWNGAGLRQNQSQLRQQAKQLFKPDLMKLLHFMSIFFLPQWTGWLRAKVFSTPYARFMRQLVSQHTKSESGDDLIDHLQQLQGRRPAKHYVHHEDFIASQAGIFLLAGFETSSALLAFTLYELAKQPRLQQRLRQELHSAFGDSFNLSYETAVKLPYLKMVCLEALRLYPAAAFINRECTQPEGFSLRPRIDFVIPCGMPAYISILGLQRDEKYWPNPLHFNPERFAPQHITQITPMTFIPFGAGPHGCIGSRLGLLQLKLGVAHILKTYRVEFCAQTVPEIRFNPHTFMLESLDELYLHFCRDPL